jgi:hypothetical protein
MEERKWSYRSERTWVLIDFIPLLTSFSLVFGFTAALLEGLPIIGLVFTVSNRVGAAMWAYGIFPLACVMHLRFII